MHLYFRGLVEIVLGLARDMGLGLDLVVVTDSSGTLLLPLIGYVMNAHSGRYQSNQ